MCAILLHVTFILESHFIGKSCSIPRSCFYVNFDLSSWDSANLSIIHTGVCVKVNIWSATSFVYQCFDHSWPTYHQSLDAEILKNDWLTRFYQIELSVRVTIFTRIQSQKFCERLCMNEQSLTHIMFGFRYGCFCIWKG